MCVRAARAGRDAWFGSEAFLAASLFIRASALLGPLALWEPPQSEILGLPKVNLLVEGQGVQGVRFVWACNSAPDRAGLGVALSCFPFGPSCAVGASAVWFKAEAFLAQSSWIVEVDPDWIRHVSSWLVQFLSTQQLASPSPSARYFWHASLRVACDIMPPPAA